jgi:hypothetical protein
MNDDKKNVLKTSPIKIPDFNKPTIGVDNFSKENGKFRAQVKIKPKNNVDYTVRGLVFFFLSILILSAGYFVYNYALDFLDSREKATEKKLVFENELVRADRSRVVSLEAGASKESVRSVIIQALLNEKVKNGEISLVMPSYLRDTTIDGERKLVSELQRGDDFFFTFAVRSPLQLRTVASEKYAVGTAGSGNVDGQDSKNFLAFSVSSAPDATREMLRYESQIYNDMKNVLKLRDIKGGFGFKDLSDNNHLLRVGYDDDGVVMVYGYGAPKTIIVAPDTQTFELIYSHLK